jgi:SAM-dependent methyltransferase
MVEEVGILHAAGSPLTTPEPEEEIGPVTDKLFGLLPSDFSSRVMMELETRCRGDLIAWLRHLEGIPREFKRQIITYGASLYPAEVTRLTRLCPANPPEDIHSMVRVEFYAGDLYNPDMIVRTLGEVDIGIEFGRSYLDFGGSSGPVVRAFYAAFPEARWHGCDPQGRSIEWARKNLPSQIDFFVSPLAPPLPDHFGGYFDGVFALSVWSHFTEAAALAWFAEMHRCIMPGGWLFFTTHGLNTLYYLEKFKLKDEQHISRLREVVMRHGFAFEDTFKESGGDWGVPSKEWGTAVMLPSWVAINLVGRGWSLKHFKVGRNQMNQDVYLLIREI